MPASASADGARRRGARPLPQGRAIFGGLLVVAAMALTVAATRDDPPDRRLPHAVAAHDLTAGQVVAASDLTTEMIDLGDAVGTRAYTDASALVGAVVVNPRAAGELVQRSDVAPATITDRSGRAAVEITFPVDPDRAPPTLSPGERVTVIATAKAAGASTTSVSVQGAVVVRYDTGDGGFSAADDAVLTLALASSDDHVAIVHDTQVAALSVVRTNSDGMTDG